VISLAQRRTNICRVAGVETLELEQTCGAPLAVDDAGRARMGARVPPGKDGVREPCGFGLQPLPGPPEPLLAQPSDHRRRHRGPESFGFAVGSPAFAVQRDLVAELLDEHAQARLWIGRRETVGGRPPPPRLPRQRAFELRFWRERPDLVDDRR